MKNIKIRNLDKKTLDKLTRISKEKGFKSREDYILLRLDNQDIRFSYSSKLENDYIVLIKRLSKVIEYNTIALNTFAKQCIDISKIY